MKKKLTECFLEVDKISFAKKSYYILDGWMEGWMDESIDGGWMD